MQNRLIINRISRVMLTNIVTAGPFCNNKQVNYTFYFFLIISKCFHDDESTPGEGDKTGLYLVFEVQDSVCVFCKRGCE